MKPRYEPRPGSIAARAAQHLRATRGRMRIGALAEAIGEDSYSLSEFLAACLKHGVIGREKEQGSWVYFAGSSPIPARPADEEPDDDAPPAAAPTALPGKASRSAFDLGASLQADGPAAATAAPPAASSAPKPGPARSSPPSLADWKAPARKARPGKAKPATTTREPNMPRTTTAVAVAAPRKTHAPRQPSIVCAHFNTGELLVEVPGQQSLRLTPVQASDLLTWLQRVQPTISAEASA